MILKYLIYFKERIMLLEHRRIMDNFYGII